jgi:hypothetical protein
MAINIGSIGIYKVKNDVIYGCFWIIKDSDLKVEFKFENEELSFSCDSENKKEIHYFSKWLIKEKDAYETFILNYLDEINKLNHISSFKGKIVEENLSKRIGIQSYIIKVQFDGIPNAVKFEFFPDNRSFYLLYKVPVPMDFKESQIGHVLKRETIQRMWEPFRNKTKYRLQLLHMLR